MIREIVTCDGCGNGMQHRCVIPLALDFQTGTFRERVDFCSLACLLNWVAKNGHRFDDPKPVVKTASKEKIK